MYHEKPYKLSFLFILALLCISLFAQGVNGALEDEPMVRLKEIARIKGVRNNQLTGYGLVVGLNGTGDSRKFTATLQMVASMLQGFGLQVSLGDVQSRNIAAVTLTATLPPFVRSGDTIDVTVSSIGDAKSLVGGVLVLSPLRAPDGRVYAVAQGSLTVGGFKAEAAGSSVQKNQVTTGKLINGAIVEQEVLMEFINEDGTLEVVLFPEHADFTTAARLAEAINRAWLPGTALALNASTIKVKLPGSYRDNPVDFLSLIEEVPVIPDNVGRIVVNERTGTVIIGHGVRVATVAVSHGNLRIRIKADIEISQPGQKSLGETVVVPIAEIETQEDKGQIVVLKSRDCLEDLVAALNGVGATPHDIASIFIALKESGALYGELIIE
jgi:flagellar P-ring protein precursor FlgI